MKRIGILLDNLGASQLAYYTILNANLLASTMEADTIVFYSNLAKICLAPKVALMPTIEAQGFSGVLIATDLKSAARLINFPGTSIKCFYTWDLEYLRPHVNKEWINLYNIYGSKELKFIARSNSHAKALKNGFGVDIIDCVDNVNLREILKCLNVI